MNIWSRMLLQWWMALNGAMFNPVWRPVALPQTLKRTNAKGTCNISCGNGSVTQVEWLCGYVCWTPKFCTSFWNLVKGPKGPASYKMGSLRHRGGWSPSGHPEGGGVTAAGPRGEIKGPKLTKKVGCGCGVRDVSSSVSIVKIYFKMLWVCLSVV